ncbi:FosX/FosE/FosI family fosfomycin resistance hydrolase [Massilia sp. TWP1-3-3]|uniref:FosX/FosE/FosI family fosfomycin resistance hydrolase n=1 Tax=Massilia sp. TWP1-3-3 TaxID=2804573 RepID=UPI003CF5D7A3
MAIRGLSHVTLIVSDLERAARLWRDALGAAQVYDSGKQTYSLSEEKFFVLGDVWVALMKGEPVARSYRHVAFAADAGDMVEYERKLRALDVEIRPARARVEGEGISLYFYDYDDNLLELHSGTLQERLAQYGNQQFTSGDG